ncbi:hypothetical protein JZU61_04230 [bacterium]|jgi:hypothetical protein|nr:hypothetical protein [bacterium]MBV5348848.1 hypothetical protein [bacterium]
MSNDHFLVAIHEASHFIIYLANCNRIQAHPHVTEVSLIPIRKDHIAYIMKQTFAPDYYEHILNCPDLPGGMKDYHKELVKDEINCLLAGMAGELVLLSIDGSDERKLLHNLKLFHKKFKESDLVKAIEYHSALGLQSIDEGALPLLPQLLITIEKVKTHWYIIEEFASILVEEVRINGDRLENLIEYYSSKMLE